MKKLLIYLMATVISASLLGVGGVAMADEPIYSVGIFDFDSTTLNYELDFYDKMEGDASVIANIESYPGVTLQMVRLGENDKYTNKLWRQDSLNVDASVLGGDKSNLALAFWLKVQDVNATAGGFIQLNASYGQAMEDRADVSLHWDYDPVEAKYVTASNEWCYVVLPVSESKNFSVMTEAQLDYIVAHIRYFMIHTSGPSQLKIDDLRVVRTDYSDSFSAVRPPRYDGTETRRHIANEYMPETYDFTDYNPAPYYKILNCDSDFQNFGHDTYIYKEGNGSVRAISSEGLADIYAGMSVAPFGSRADGDTMQAKMSDRVVEINEKDAILGFWIHYQSNLPVGVMNSGSVQIGSANGSDKDLYSFSIYELTGKIIVATQNDAYGEGWAWVTFDLSRAVKIGNPDLKKINFFRVFMMTPDKTQTFTMRIDDVRIIDGSRPGALNAPVYNEDYLPLGTGTGDYDARVSTNSFNYREVTTSVTEREPAVAVKRTSYVWIAVLGVLAVASLVTVLLKGGKI